MFQQRTLSRVLIPLLLSLALVPTNLTAEETCVTSAQGSHQRALVQVQGQAWLDVECSDRCENDASNALASYERALVQLEGIVIFDVACTDACATDTVDAIASYERAVLQAHGQIMSGSPQANCGTVA